MGGVPTDADKAAAEQLKGEGNDFFKANPNCTCTVPGYALGSWVHDGPPPTTYLVLVT